MADLTTLRRPRLDLLREAIRARVDDAIAAALIAQASVETDPPDLRHEMIGRFLDDARDVAVLGDELARLDGISLRYPRRRP